MLVITPEMIDELLIILRERSEKLIASADSATTTQQQLMYWRAYDKYCDAQQILQNVQLDIIKNQKS